MTFRLSDVTKWFRVYGREVCALRHVSLYVSPGDIVGLYGPSGSGKTTLQLVLAGLDRPDEGRVRWGDIDPYQLPPNSRAQLRASQIGLVFQQFHLVPYLHALDNVLLATIGRSGAAVAPALRSATAADAATAMPLISSPMIQRPVGRAALRESAMRWLSELGLADRWQHLPEQLSVGERQRVAVARALFHQPQLVLADEPTGNLDDESAERVMLALRQFVVEGGAVLMATHDPRAMEFATSQWAMHQGELLPHLPLNRMALARDARVQLASSYAPSDSPSDSPPC